MASKFVRLMDLYCWQEIPLSDLMQALKDGTLTAEGCLVVSSGEAILSPGERIPMRKVDQYYPPAPITRDWWLGIGVGIELHWPAGVLRREVASGFQMIRSIQLQNSDVERLWPGTFPESALPSADLDRLLPEPTVVSPEPSTTLPSVGSIALDNRGPTATSPAQSLTDTGAFTDDGTAANRKYVGGRPTVADWPAIKDALRDQIKIFGHPDLTNPPGWRRLADVEKWAAELLRNSEITPATSTLRTNVRRLLAELRSEV